MQGPACLLLFIQLLLSTLVLPTGPEHLVIFAFLPVHTRLCPPASLHTLLSWRTDGHPYCSGVAHWHLLQVGCPCTHSLDTGSPSVVLTALPAAPVGWSSLPASQKSRESCFHGSLPSPDRKSTSSLVSKAVKVKRVSMHWTWCCFCSVLLCCLSLASPVPDPRAKIPYLSLIFQQVNPLFLASPKLLVEKQ